MSEVGGLSATSKQNGFKVHVIDGIYFGNRFSDIVKILVVQHPLLIGLIFQWEHQP